MIQDKIGEGAFGVVHLAIPRHSCDPYREMRAVKTLKKQCFLNWSSEIKYLHSMKSPFVMKMEAVYETQSDVHIVTELYRRGDLLDYLFHHWPLKVHISGSKPTPFCFCMRAAYHNVFTFRLFSHCPHHHSRRVW